MAGKLQMEASVFPSTSCSILEDCNQGEERIITLPE